MPIRLARAARIAATFVRGRTLQAPATELGHAASDRQQITALDMARSVHTVVSAGFALGQFASGWAAQYRDRKDFA
jgi:hypothetical protein